MKLVLEFSDYDEMLDYCARLAGGTAGATAPTPTPSAVHTPPPCPVQGAPVIPTPAAPVTPPPIPVKAPTAVKQYTADELSLASRPIVEAGRQQEVLDFLHSFTFTDKNGAVRSVQSIMELPTELYGAFADGIRRMGGRI